jgi:tRNA nucleotidyltransferase/poly(A) polymerase
MNIKFFTNAYTELAKLSKRVKEWIRVHYPDYYEDFGIWLVGGLVRDLLLGLEPKDYDIVVNLPMIEIFKEALEALGYKSIEFSKEQENDSKFGVLKFRIQVDGELVYIDAVIPRIEEYDGITRKPKVKFATGGIKEDALRRDFTINALYLIVDEMYISSICIFDPETYYWRRIKEVTDMIKDPTGYGLADLKGVNSPYMNAPILRLTNSAEKVFGDDPLRILRAFRFLMKGFVFHEDLEKALIKYMYLFEPGKKISMERIQDELVKILINSKDGYIPEYVFRKMNQYGLLEQFLPEVARMWGYNQKCPKYHKLDLWGHTFSVVQETWFSQFNGINDINFAFKPSPYSFESDIVSLSEIEKLNANGATCMMLAALLHDVAKPETKSIGADGTAHYIGHDKKSAEMAMEILKELRFSNDTQFIVSAIIERHMLLKDYQGEYNEKRIKRIRSKFIVDFHGKRVDLIIPCLYLMSADDADNDKDKCGVKLFSSHWMRYAHENKNKYIPPFKIDSGIVMEVFGLTPGKELGQVMKDLKDLQVESDAKTTEELIEEYKLTR